MRVFISYSGEDSKFARLLEDHMKKSGLDPWCFENPHARGGKIREKIEEAINGADAFLALLSPNYLNSETSTHEADMAFNREKSLRKGIPRRLFIYVAKVGNVDYLNAGFWSNYDWFDLTGPNQEELIQNLINKLKGGFGKDLSSMPTASVSGPKDWPTFQNREPELNKIIDNLTNIAGTHFWLVIAAPQMGKTWFLDELSKRLRSTQPNLWMIRSLDVSRLTLDTRVNVPALLSQCFNLEPGFVGDDYEIAVKIKRLDHSLLVLLDRAELLERSIEKEFRARLCKIYNALRNSGHANIRLAFIASSCRTHHGWRGIYPSPSFGELTLSHFNDNVVELVLRDMAKKNGQNSFGDNEYRALAKRLYRVTEGLPGLLVKYLEWIRQVQFVGLERMESQKTFDSLACPYAESSLLSTDSLVPVGGDQLEPKSRILKSTLLGLVPYRRITRPHLELAVRNDRNIEADLHTLAWNTDDLWNAVKDTHLMHPTPDPWLVIHPAIRRLLFRYQHTSKEAQAQEHLSADQFYQKWDGLAGQEAWTFLIERIWHRSEYYRLAPEENTSRKIEQLVSDWFKTYTLPKNYTCQDIHDFVQELVYGTTDGLGEEFQETTAAISNELLEQVFHIIKQSKEVKQ